jgi:hypothetical protein
MIGKRITTARLMLVVAVIALLFGGFRFHRDQSKDTERNAWVGWSRDGITARLGVPDEVHSGDYDPTNEYRAEPPGSVTLYYRTRLGHLYLWVKPGAGGGVCYDSLWYRDGILF